MLGLRAEGTRRKLAAIMVSKHIMTLRSLMNIFFSNICIFQCSRDSLISRHDCHGCHSVLAPAFLWGFALAKRPHARTVMVIFVPLSVPINKSGGGLVVKTLHQCVLQTQARAHCPFHLRWLVVRVIRSDDDAEIVSSNLTRRSIFLLSFCISHSQSNSCCQWICVATLVAQDTIFAIIDSVEG
jgi:hypothetical protein